MELSETWSFSTSPCLVMMCRTTALTDARPGSLQNEEKIKEMLTNKHSGTKVKEDLRRLDGGMHSL